MNRGPSPTLTRTEREVLAALALGKWNAEIARDRGVSIKTVQSQVIAAMRKLGVRNRVEASNEYWRLAGCVPPAMVGKAAPEFHGKSCASAGA